MSCFIPTYSVVPVKKRSTYGQFYLNIAQYPGTANVPERVKLNVEAFADYMVLQTNTIKVLKSGTFQVTMDGCVEHLSGPAAILDVWLRLNGTNVDYTTAHTRINTTIEFSTISKTVIFTMEENDTLEAWFAASNIDVGFSYAPAITTPYNAPQRPAFSLSILLIE